MKLLDDLRPDTRETLVAAAEHIWSTLGGHFDVPVPNLFVKYCRRGKSKYNLARTIGSAIYDLPVKFTGMVSTRLVDSHGFYNGKKKCPEHFYSRQRSGRKIVKLYESGELTPELLLELLDKYRQVHWVTSEENSRLRTIQKKYDNLPHYKHYEMAGIVLVPRPSSPPRYYYNTYIINKKKFNNIRDASLKTGFEPEYILKKCLSKARSNMGFVKLAA